jgi:hypothetical protein
MNYVWIYLVIGFFVSFALMLKIGNPKKDKPTVMVLAFIGMWLLWPGMILYRYM